MRDMYELMDRWGAWAASENSGVDWQPIAAGFKGLLPHGKKSRLQCDDDEGIVIDGCVARLRKYRPDEYELVIAHFVIGLSLRNVAKKRKVSDGTIRKQLQTALGFIEGVIMSLNPNVLT
ncbi:antitermination protein [Salmonella enterica subsp. enterica]|nr:antitermination protein [Salmonella enterica subsp. enterica serovar Soumbedioune]EEC0861468.1 antitermination protein [Salmonella enterica subsp. enterica serovar Soumbedioune]